jgi:hypothetical protein
MKDGWGGTEDEHRHVRMLLWVTEQPDSRPNLGAFHDFDDGLLDQTAADGEAMEQMGWVTRDYVMARMHGLYVIATAMGRALAAQIREQRSNRRVRERACSSALLSWLDAENAVGDASKALSLQGFYLDPRALYYGEMFTVDDADQAAAWLDRQGLIGGHHVDEFAGPVAAFLTDQGEECIEDYDGDVRRYMAAMKQPHPQHSFSVSVGGSVTGSMQIAGRDGVQTVSVTGSVDGLALALQGIADIIRALGYADAQEDELAEMTRTAVAELQAEHPDLGVLRRFGEWIVNCAQQGGQAAVVAAVTLVTSGALQSAEQLFGLPGGGH